MLWIFKDPGCYTTSQDRSKSPRNTRSDSNEKLKKKKEIENLLCSTCCVLPDWSSLFNIWERMLITIFAFAAIVFCRFYKSSLKTSSIISILSFCTKHMSYLKVSLFVRLVGWPVNLRSNRLTPSRRTLLVKMLVHREVKSSPCTLSWNLSSHTICVHSLGQRVCPW